MQPVKDGGGGVGAQFRVIISGDHFYQSLDFLFCLLNINILCLEEPNVG